MGPSGDRGNLTATKCLVYRAYRWTEGPHKACLHARTKGKPYVGAGELRCTLFAGGRNWSERSRNLGIVTHRTNPKLKNEKRPEAETPGRSFSAA
jgi:hypothetical protein